MRLQSDALIGGLLMTYGAYFSPNLSPSRGNLGIKTSAFKVPSPSAAGSFVPELQTSTQQSRNIPTAPTMISLGPLGRFINKIRGRGAAAGLGSSSVTNSNQIRSTNLENVNSMVETDGKLSIERSGGQQNSYSQLSNDGSNVQLQPAKKKVRGCC